MKHDWKYYLTIIITLSSLLGYWSYKEYTKPHTLTETERYQWAVDFCGGREKVHSYRNYKYSNPDVLCTDARSSDIPLTRDKN